MNLHTGLTGNPTFIQCKLDLAKLNADIKFGEILPIGSQDIERKQNFGTNQGP